MPKNTIGGKGFKRGKKEVNQKDIPFEKEGETEYARIENLLGNGRADVILLKTGEKKLGVIRGNMYKKVWINKNDIVLVFLRDFEKSKCDIIFKYDDDQVRYLIKTQRLTFNNNNNNSLDEVEFVEEINEELNTEEFDDTFVDEI